MNIDQKITGSKENLNLLGAVQASPDHFTPKKAPEVGDTGHQDNEPVGIDCDCDVRGRPCSCFDA